MPTWRALYRQAAERLGDRTEARRIVQRAAGLGGAEWLLAMDDRAPQRCVPFVDRMVERRLAGEPLQYVLGQWGFRRLDLYVDHRVLIPRPETEQVVDAAIARLAGRVDPVVVDLGTGSGCIALSMALEVPGARVWASDRSPEALAVASANLAGLGGAAATRVRLAEGEWYGALPGELRGTVDLVVSNPPYLAEHEVAGLDPAVADWEPRDALVAGPRGTEAIEVVVGQAPTWLAPGGSVVVELAPWQAAAAVDLAAAAGFAGWEVAPDLAGRPRALVAWLAR